MMAALAGCSGCLSSGSGLETPEIATSQLSSPGSFTFSGSGTAATASTTYLLADSTGAIQQDSNLLTSTVPDPALPIQLATPGYAYYDQMASGNCNLISLYTQVTGDNGNTLATQIAATGCTDQATIAISLDTSQLVDAAGNSGNTLATVMATVDDAPAVTTKVTGNSTADGTGNTESTSGYYSLSGDNSIVVTFSKSLTGGTLNASLTGCYATISTTNLVANSSGTTVVWTLGNLGSVSANQSCTLNVSGITDAIGNPDDPNDTNQSMTFTFH